MDIANLPANASIGKRIQAARLAKGLNQYDIADMLAVSKSTVSRWETNQSIPDKNTAPKLAAVLGVELGWIVGNISLPKRSSKLGKTKTSSKRHSKSIFDIIKPADVASPSEISEDIETVGIESDTIANMLHLLNTVIAKFDCTITVDKYLTLTFNSPQSLISPQMLVEYIHYVLSINELAAAEVVDGVHARFMLDNLVDKFNAVGGGHEDKDT